MKASTRTIAGLSAGCACSTECTRWPTVGGRLRNCSRAAEVAPSSVTVVTEIPFDAYRWKLRADGREGPAARCRAAGPSRPLPGALAQVLAAPAAGGALGGRLGGHA